jgi:hypothetical protein
LVGVAHISLQVQQVYVALVDLLLAVLVALLVIEVFLRLALM